MKRLLRKFIVGVDFDGTIAKHQNFPAIGDEIPGALDGIKKFQKAGAAVVLWTMRSDSEKGQYLKMAVDWLNEKDVHLDGYNSYPQEWTDSPKLYSHTLIDDLAFGCPLIYDEISNSKRPYVNWQLVTNSILDMIGAFNDN